VLSNVLEALGVACFAAFAGFIWWPAALLPIAIYLIITALALDAIDDVEVPE
jgi:uncharacterized membrane protein